MTRCCLLLVCVVLLGGQIANAQGTLPTGRVVAGQVLGTDTVRVEVLKRLVEGRVAEAIEYWVLATGQTAPAWLLATRTAFDTSKQVVGACQGVAQTLHTAFTRLGGKPDFIQLTAKTEHILFEMPGGKDMRLTDTGYHVVVRTNGRAYDAYTGAAGLPWAEYVNRLASRFAITQRVADTTARLP